MAPCSIKWCSKSSRTSNMQKDGITFHLFPQDPKMKEQWIDATKRENWFPSKYSTICSRHFTEDCFIRMKNRRRLLKSAVPTLFLPLLSTGNKPDEETASTSKLSTTQKKRKTFPGSPSNYNSHNKKRLCRRIIELNEIIIYKNKQLKNLREKTQYMRKRIASLKTVLNELQTQKLINTDNVGVLAGN